MDKKEIIQSSKKSSLKLQNKDKPFTPSTVGMREIIEGKSSMTLQALRREQNYKSARVFVTVWVVKLQETLEVKKKMGDDSILMASDLILEDYYYLTGADLRLLFKRIVTGHYGVMYESLTIDKLMTYFSLYAKERWTEAERISLENHNQFKNKYNG